MNEKKHNLLKKISKIFNENIVDIKLNSIDFTEMEVYGIEMKKLFLNAIFFIRGDGDTKYIAILYEYDKIGNEEDFELKVEFEEVEDDNLQNIIKNRVKGNINTFNNSIRDLYVLN